MTTVHMGWTTPGFRWGVVGPDVVDRSVIVEGGDGALVGEDGLMGRWTAYGSEAAFVRQFGVILEAAVAVSR